MKYLVTLIAYVMGAVFACTVLGSSLEVTVGMITGSVSISAIYLAFHIYWRKK